MNAQMEVHLLEEAKKAAFEHETQTLIAYATYLRLAPHGANRQKLDRLEEVIESRLGVDLQGNAMPF